MARVATFLIVVEFGLPVLHTSTLRFFETSLCSTACMRPELVVLNAVRFMQFFVPLAASLKFCEQSYPHIVEVEPCRCVMLHSCPSSFSYFFRWLR